ncbi:MAG: hypothetical protein PHS80_08400 [Methanothrix sp.]|nr:hypothetical protein [Methanothrix sp.]MDD4447392.1 hypothetical protein [Methanothrix sp.]
MAKVPECIGGPQKHLVKPAKLIVADGRDLELKTAKQILAEVFHTQLCDVEDMIMRRLVEKDLIDEKCLQEVKCQQEERAGTRVNASHANWGTWQEMFWVE